LVHVTVVPTATVSGFAPNPALPRFLALVGINTVTDEPVDVVEGVELGEEELLHAAAAAARTATIRMLRNAIRLLDGSVSAARPFRNPVAERDL
jgi:hypothetical protein